MKKWIIFLVALALYQNWGKIERAFRGAPQLAHGPVVLYATERCGYCTLTRKLLAEHDVPYVELDVDRSRDAYDEVLRLTGRNAVPVLVVEERMVMGYNREAMLDAVYAWKN